MDADLRILVGALLLLGGVLLSKTSSRLGVPSLLLFLGLGMVAGSDGLLGIEFDDVELARSIGIVALTLILFSGGLGTRWDDVRPALRPGMSLATIGVLVSAATLGLLASLVLGIDPLQGLLLGGIIASTDAAAVFSVLRSRGVRLGTRLRSLLELESGSNDPASVFLTIGVISLIQGDGTTVVELVWDFVVQMSLGVAAGLAAAAGAVRLINRLRLDVVEIPLDRGGIEKAEMPCQRYVEGSTVISVRGRSGLCWTRAVRSLRSLENWGSTRERWGTG